MNKTVYKNSILYIVKIICLIVLLLVPIKLAAVAIEVEGMDHDWPPIIKQLEAAHAKAPDDKDIINSLANAYNNYGLLLAQQNNWDQAENYLQQALSTNPTNDAIKQNLSNIYASHGLDLMQNQTELSYTSYTHGDAKQLANKALSLNPKNVYAYVLLGDVEYINQNMDGAQQAWKSAAQYAPDNDMVQKRLAKITREAQTEAGMNTKYNMFFLIKIDPALEKLAGFDINESLDIIRTEVSGELNYIQNFKIPVIVYTTDNYNSSVPDAPSWSEGAFDGKLRIVLTKYKNNVAMLKTTMVHEYTHAVIQQITKGNIPRWLNEGIAKYMEYKFGIAPRINYLASAYSTNHLIAWDQINEAIISPNKNEALLAYQQSFNFVYYLIQRYGLVKLRTLLNTLGANVEFEAAVQQVYGAPLATIQTNWKIWLSGHVAQWAEAPLTEVSD